MTVFELPHFLRLARTLCLHGPKALEDTSQEKQYQRSAGVVICKSLPACQLSSTDKQLHRTQELRSRLAGNGRTQAGMQSLRESQQTDRP